MKSWKTLSSKKIAENPFWSYWEDRFETPKGITGTWYYHSNNNAVAVLLQSADGRFVLINEYRYLFDKLAITPVLGAVNAGEPPEEAARREILEEAGYRANTLIDIGRFATAPAFSKEIFNVYLARDLVLDQPNREETEDIETVIMTSDEIEEAISSGNIWNAQMLSVWAVYKSYQKHPEL